MLFSFARVSALLLGLSTVSAKVYFKETFDSGNLDANKWVVSKHRSDYGKWEVTAGLAVADPKASIGLKTTEDAKFYAISAPLAEELDHKDKTLVLQYSVRYEKTLECGGSYIKLIPAPLKPEDFHGETPYNIMFGPDWCGMDEKTHAILHYKGQNHLIKAKIAPKKNEGTHVYTLVIKPDQTYQVLIDLEEKHTGSLIEHWDLLPPKTIPDPAASKPADWVDEEELDDPNDKKPEGYDDIPEMITDADAKKPDDWDDEMDGEWEAPKIANPEYKGPWKPKKIKNPKYKGPWVHPEISNPEFQEDTEIYAYKSAYVGFDLWQVQSGSVFDNIIVTDSLDEAKKFAEETWTKYKDADAAAFDKLKKEKEEEIKKENLKKIAEEEKKKAEEKKDDAEEEDDDKKEEL